MTRNAFIFLGLLASACGAAQTRTEVAEPSHTGTLAIMPVANDRYPRLASALDRALRAAPTPGMRTIVPKVSIEVVQLSIECVEASAPCYAAVGKSLQADELLFARVEPASPKELRVTVTRTNAEGGVVGQARSVYAGEDEAAPDAARLVSEALEHGSRSQ
jgi:hypothetical protein